MYLTYLGYNEATKTASLMLSIDNLIDEDEKYLNYLREFGAQIQERQEHVTDTVIELTIPEDQLVIFSQNIRTNFITYSGDSEQEAADKFDIFYQSLPFNQAHLSATIPTIVLTFDIDNTLLNSQSKGIDWNGGIRLWQKLCEDLTEYAESKGVRVVFGIVSQKKGPDDLAFAAVRALQDFLHIVNKDDSRAPIFDRAPRFERDYSSAFYIQNAAILKKSDFTQRDSFTEIKEGDKNIVFTPVHIAIKYSKFNSLIDFQLHYKINDRRLVAIVDDKDSSNGGTVIETVRSNGFTAYSAAKLAENKSDTDKGREARADAARVLVNVIFTTMKVKIDALVKGCPTQKDKKQRSLPINWCQAWMKKKLMDQETAREPTYVPASQTVSKLPLPLLTN